MSDRLCVVMPVYNEQEAIGPVLEKWAMALDDLGIDYVIRPYNDGSKDNSLAVMRAAAEQLPRVEVRDKKNGGHGNTILTGYRDAATDGFDWCFQIDSDDEMGPEKFGELWERRDDYDFLVGIRDGRIQQLPRKIISFVSRLCVRIFYGKSVWDVNTPYRLMRISAFKDFYAAIPLATFAPNVILSGLAARNRLRCCEIRVPQHDRTTGEVSIKKWKLFKAAARSFAQTIAFALVIDGSVMSRICLLLVAIWGAAFSLFLLMAPCRVLFALPLALILFWRRKWICNVGASVLASACKHPVAWLLGVVSVGCLERFMLVLMFPGLVDQTMSYTPSGVLITDWPGIWDIAIKASEGIWEASKSWTTTLGYGMLIDVFGQNLHAACVLNTVLNLVSALLLAILCGRWFGRRAGIIAAAMSFCLPYFAVHSLNTATEHMYGMFMTASLLCLDCVWSASSGRNAIFRSILAGVLIWLTIWSRGEGVLLLGVCFVSAILIEGILRVRWRRCGMVCAALFAVSALCGLLAWRINGHINGAKTVFCSNDNLWPRLFGANVESGGTINGPDYCLMYEAWRNDHPQSIEKPSTQELEPYIRKEIARRWREMPLRVMIRHIIKKEWRDWCVDTLPLRMANNAFWRIGVKVATVPFSTFLAVCGLMFWLLFALKVVRGAQTIRQGACVMISILLLGNVVVLAVAESSYRYGHLFPLLFPAVVAGLIGNSKGEL